MKHPRQEVSCESILLQAVLRASALRGEGFGLAWLLESTITKDVLPTAATAVVFQDLCRGHGVSSS